MAQLGFKLDVSSSAQDNGYDRYSKSLTETLGAIASDNWEYNPFTATKTHRSLNVAERTSMRENENRIDRQELNKEYSNLGLYLPFVDKNLAIPFLPPK